MMKVEYFLLLSNDQKKIIETGGIIDITPFTLRTRIQENKKILEDHLVHIKKLSVDKHKETSEFAKRQLAMKPKIVKVTLSY